MMEIQSYKVLSAGDTEELRKNIRTTFSNFNIKQELEEETESGVHPLQGSELEAILKFEHSCESSDDLGANIVKCELVEFKNDFAQDNFSQNHLKTVQPDKIKTETEILSDEPPFGIGDNNTLYKIDTHSDSNLNSDLEHDPFADVDSDPSFSNVSTTQESYSINTVVVDDSANPSSAKRILPTVNALKQKRKRLMDKFQCQLCLETQTSKNKLTAHLEICAASHKNRSRFCVYCNSLFGYRHGYKRHALNIHGIKIDTIDRYPLKCELCPKCYLHEASLAVHLKSCHNINSSTVNGHYSSNPSVSPTLDLQCKLCLETQSSESMLKAHLEICAASHKDRYRFCVLCNKLFSHPPAYRKHAFGKHGIDQESIPRGHPFKCQLCPCSFALKESLISHSASKHESSTTTSDHKLKLRPFNCLECTLRFKTPSDLRRHIKSHSGDLPFKCQVPNCDKAFKSTHSRKAHLRQCHSNKPFQCQKPNCRKTFKTNGEFQCHQLRHHVS